jgi:hypothetical protein
MSECWRDGRITAGEVSALKVFCEVHQLTVEEHDSVVDELGVDRHGLIDDANQRFADWLRARREELPPGSGALRYKPAGAQPPWRRRLPNAPAGWQNALAGLAGVLVFVGLVIVFVS